MEIAKVKRKYLAIGECMFALGLAFVIWVFFFLCLFVFFALLFENSLPLCSAPRLGWWLFVSICDRLHLPKGDEVWTVECTTTACPTAGGVQLRRMPTAGKVQLHRVPATGGREVTLG